MAIEQQTFFGASIRGFNTSIGWGSQISTLTIDLVEDPVNGDVFNPNPIGFPAYFNYYGFSFGGIVQKYSRSGSFSGNPTWQVVLVDPREILDGVQLVIDGYSGSTSAVPNVYNIFGALESASFGSSQVNETGMPWRLLYNTLLSLNASNPINFRGQAYYLDLSVLPALPDYYRVGGGTSISVMDFVNRMCEDGACDFFFNLRQDAFGNNVIRLHTISRAIQPVFGAIENFIGQTEGAIGHEIGLELRNEVTSKFLVGGKVATLFAQSDNQLEDGPEDDTILQFFGFDINNIPIIIRADPNNFLNYTFTLDSRNVEVQGVGETYNTDCYEMRTALVSRDSWESYLVSQDKIAGAHFGKATRIGILGRVRDDFLRFIKDLPDVEAFDALEPRELMPFKGKHIRDAAGALKPDIRHEENVGRLYDYVKSFADEFFGRKFMVRIPDIQAYINPDTNQIVTSLEPTDGGYIEESALPTAIDNGLVPSYTNFIQLPDGRLQCYVRFDDFENLDTSGLSTDDFYLDGDSIFVKAEVEPSLIFLDYTTASSPRVVITLPAPIYPKLGEEANSNFGFIEKFLKDKAGAGIDVGAGVEGGLGLPAADIDTKVHRILARMGAEQLYFGWTGVPSYPSLVVVPLQSNTLTYGPWYATGALGAVDFEQDESLVPWNYGGYEFMNLAAQAKVNDAFSGQQVSEAGTIEVPDVPTVNIGTQLLNSGPYVTNVTCSVGLDGVKTTYRMEVWTPRFGKAYKQNVERIVKLQKNLQAQRRLLREFIKVPPAGAAKFKARGIAIDKVARIKPESTIGYIGGEMYPKDASDGTSDYVVNIALLPSYHGPNQIGENYENKALMSLEGLFVPFSTDTEKDNYLKFDELDPDVASEHLVTRNTLSYFGNHGYDNEDSPTIRAKKINTITANDELQEDDSIVNSPQLQNDETEVNNERGIALRGPLYIGGWGKDVTGDDILSTPNYKNVCELHKIGPLDVRWNPQTKVWTPIVEERNFLFTFSNFEAYHENDNGIIQGFIPYRHDGLTYNELNDTLVLSSGNASSSNPIYKNNENITKIYNITPWTDTNTVSLRCKNVNGFWQVDKPKYRPILYSAICVNGFADADSASTLIEWDESTNIGDVATINDDNQIEIVAPMSSSRLCKVYYELEFELDGIYNAFTATLTINGVSTKTIEVPPAQPAYTFIKVAGSPGNDTGLSSAVKVKMSDYTWVTLQKGQILTSTLELEGITGSHPLRYALSVDSNGTPIQVTTTTGTGFYEGECRWNGKIFIEPYVA